jgi:hypothetical protein
MNCRGIRQAEARLIWPQLACVGFVNGIQVYVHMNSKTGDLRDLMVVNDELTEKWSVDNWVSFVPRTFGLP